ncbi:hypothetical protein BDZ89DRAFT_1147949 [Hymenopellis radicata]|nr:hypothetical protein BDZ89DRAFT_1147949 [Hymenopellis radicata]
MSISTDADLIRLQNIFITEYANLAITSQVAIQGDLDSEVDIAKTFEEGATVLAARDDESVFENVLILWNEDSLVSTQDEPFLNPCATLSSPCFWMDREWLPVDAQSRDLLNAPAQTDIMIVVWLEDACNRVRSTGASLAVKLRTALTELFSVEGGHGHAVWNSELCDGNPSLSLTVSFYLFRRKRQVQAATIPVITASQLGELYLRRWSPTNRADRARARASAMAHAIMVIGFVCLLRLNEVLALQVEDTSFQYDEFHDTYSMVIRIPFRAERHICEIRQFPPDVIHLCPVRSLRYWLSLSHIQSGLIFPSGKEPVAMSQETFLMMQRNLLLDIGESQGNVFDYTSHSLRRGGAQWARFYLKWPPRRIAQWAGW